MRVKSALVVLSVLGCATWTLAQQSRPASPRGSAATQVLGQWTQEKPDAPKRYTGGKWIEIDYGRPILRQRDNVFGSGADYGKAISDGSPVWRVGANKSTRLRTEATLRFGDKTLQPGEYSLFVELKSPTEWTLILSTHAAQETFDRNEKVALWGSTGYDPKMDALRVPMKVTQGTTSVDQLTVGFVDVTRTAGKLAISWDKTSATAEFAAVP